MQVYKARNNTSEEAMQSVIVVLRASFAGEACLDVCNDVITFTMAYLLVNNKGVQVIHFQTFIRTSTWFALVEKGYRFCGKMLPLFIGVYFVCCG